MNDTTYSAVADAIRSIAKPPVTRFIALGNIAQLTHCAFAYITERAIVTLLNTTGVVTCELYSIAGVGIFRLTYNPLIDRDAVATYLNQVVLAVNQVPQPVCDTDQTLETI